MKKIFQYSNRKKKASFPFCKLSVFGFILVAFLPLFVKSENTGNIPKSISQKDTIHIAAEPDYPPYSIVDKKGKAEGFAIDVFMASAKAAGYEVNIKIGLWNQIKNELENGKIDALPVVGRTPEREKIFDFTLAYLTLKGAAFVKMDDNSIFSKDDLKGKKILVMKGDNAEEFVRREKISDFINTTNTFEEAFQKLLNEEGDVVITQKIIGLKIINSLKITKRVKPVNVDLGFDQDFCFAVKKGNSELRDRLNEGLSVIIADNSFEKIQNKWFGPTIKEKIGAKELLKLALFILLPLILLMILLWIIFLRNEIKRRTKSLYNEIAGHQHTLRDLGEKQVLLEKSEQQIRLLLDSTDEGIYGVDLSGICTFINKSAVAILGYTSSTELTGKIIHDLIHHTHSNGQKCPAEDCEIHKNILFGKGTKSDNDIFWRADKTSFYVEFSSFPIRQGGKLTGGVVTFKDITERKKAEAELLRLKDELEVKVAERTAELEEKVMKLGKSQKALLFMVEDLNRITIELKEERRKLEISNKELDAFTYSVSHDLRAPLRAINGFAGFLSDDYFDKLDDEGKRFINVIRENASKMDQLINDMLTLSRISRTEKKMEPVDFNMMVRNIIEALKEQTPTDGYEIIIHELPVVKCDLGLIKQVWQNLIQNAFKYSFKSEIKRIEIGFEKGDNQYRFFVKDFGAGFDPRYTSKLFGVFQRLHTEKEFEGTGVGLAIVKQIVTLHGGTVEAEGEINKGAKFYFSLPI